MFQFQFFKIPKTLSRSYCTRALQTLEKVVKKPQQGIINLIVISEEEMARMNKQFRGKEGPTDILTFSYRNKSGLRVAESPDFIVGEIYLCLEKIKTYAQERGVTYKEQLEYIIIHGLVHLMGYDHENDTDWKKMEKIEKKIQSEIEQ